MNVLQTIIRRKLKLLSAGILSITFSCWLYVSITTPASKQVKELPKLNRTGLAYIYHEKYKYKEALHHIPTSGTVCPQRIENPEKQVKVHKVYAPLPLLEELGFHLRTGGTYIPDCKPEQKIAIIIPFRNRDEHLSVWLLHLHPFLQKQDRLYTIFLANQVVNSTFNKGVLMNAAFMEAAKLDRFDCFIFHDVDLLPQDDRITYSCTDEGIRHLAYGLEEWNYRVFYNALVGGAIATTWQQYLQVNGFSNQHFGWGGEDDDFYIRIRKNNVKIVRYPINVARYTMVQHQRDSGNKINSHRYKLIEAALTTNIQAEDGLNNLVYDLQSVEKLPLFTRLNISFDVDSVKQAKPQPTSFPYLGTEGAGNQRAIS